MRLKYVKQPLNPSVQTEGATLREMRVEKGRGGGVGSNAYFSRPTLLTKKANYWASNKVRPAETINTKVSGKVNLIFYKLNLFPIFLVDKVKKQTNEQTEKLSFIGL